MDDWEQQLNAEMVPVESTPIYDALYREYRAKMWAKLGFTEVKENKDADL